MQREPILAEAWYHHLLKSGLDAEKFREMLSRGNSNSAQQNPGKKPQQFANNLTNILHSTQKNAVISH